MTDARESADLELIYMMDRIGGRGVAFRGCVGVGGRTEKSLARSREAAKGAKGTGAVIRSGIFGG